VGQSEDRGMEEKRESSAASAVYLLSGLKRENMNNPWKEGGFQNMGSEHDKWECLGSLGMGKGTGNLGKRGE